MKDTPMLPGDIESRAQSLLKADMVAPYYRLLGMKVNEVGEGSSRLTLEFRKDLTHPYGIMHGGALASLADSAVAIALLGLCGHEKKVLTIELKINYFQPVDSGAVEAECRIVFSGTRTAYGEVDLVEGGRLVARATSTYMLV